MQALKTVIDTNSQLAIGKNKLNPIGNRPTSVIVDRLLEDYSDLIDPAYTKWFAGRFYNIPFDQLHRAASEARNDGHEPKRLFCHLIRKIST